MDKLFTRRRLNVGRKKANVIRQKKKRRGAAEISVGAALTGMSCSSIPPNAKSTVANVTRRENKHSDIAGINVGAASTGRSLKLRSTFAESVVESVIHLEKRRAEIAGRKFLSAGAVTTMRSGT
jgi:hypothetical protein